MMAGQQYIEHSRLPGIIRLGNWGIWITVLGLVAGGAIMSIVDLFFIPGIQGNGIPPWLWPILILIWMPGFIGLLISYYSVARYPYLSLATGGGPALIVSRSWIWTFLGSVFWVLSPLMMLSVLVGEFQQIEVIAMLYLAIELAFAGFLLTFYRRAKHPTIATFLELTHLFGFIIFPLYIPTILLGSIRCRRFLRTLPCYLDDTNSP